MEFLEQVPLAPYTTFQIGGPARWFAEAVSEADIAAAVSFADERSLPLFVLGGGSNLLVADTGFSGLVLRIALRGILSTDQGVAHSSRPRPAKTGMAWWPTRSRRIVPALSAFPAFPGQWAVLRCKTLALTGRRLRKP